MVVFRREGCGSKHNVSKKSGTTSVVHGFQNCFQFRNAICTVDNFIGEFILQFSRKLWQLD